MKGRKSKIWLKALCCVLLAMAAIAGCYKLRHYVIAVKAKQERMAKFDSAEKVEQVIGMAFPSFRLKRCEESVLEEKSPVHYAYRGWAEFKELPSADFFEDVANLCDEDSVQWHKNDGVYLYDSIRATFFGDVLVLSLLFEEGKREFFIEYDVMNGIKL